MRHIKLSDENKSQGPVPSSKEEITHRIIGEQNLPLLTLRNYLEHRFKNYTQSFISYSYFNILKIIF